LDGCERFLLNPEALQAEVDAIRAAKQTYQVDNIHVVLPKIRGYKEITDMKKLLNSFRLHRNNRMRLFVEIATPALLFEISKINKGEIDGFVLNLKLFAKL
jgi:phosphoenolpyruvate synthase/pyruvate phosphate dikinase